MSFNDLEQGYGVSTSQRSRPSQQGKLIKEHLYMNMCLTLNDSLDGQVDYKTLTQRVSQQVFHINGNITSIERLIGFLGTARDAPELRNKL